MIDNFTWLNLFNTDWSMKKMPKLVMINPVRQDYRLAQQGFKVQPLNLAYLAALTPDEWKIEISDENISRAEIKTDADLVGITTLTSTVNRAYQLSQLYRRAGIPVVLGGIHASMVPDEAQQFADSVVVGEAEAVWPTVLENFREGKLKHRYHGKHVPFRNPVYPRRDLLSKQYTIASIQTSRGCPFNCEFCSVKAFNGAQFRQREPKDVLDELESIPQKLVFFTDDNLVGYSHASRKRARKIFQGIIDRKLNKKWFCQTSINFAEDMETLGLAARSGCVLVLVGIESIDDKVLKGKMNKQINSQRGSSYYRKFLAELHKHNLIVLGTMVFGNDEAGEQIFEDTTRFYRESGLDIPWPGLLTPYPGTRLFERMMNDGRLLYTNFPEDWDKYNSTFVTRPMHGSQKQFFEKFRDFALSNFTTGKAIVRALKTFAYSRSPARSALVYNFNKSLSRRYRLGLSPEKVLEKPL